jgi:polyisoprenoid-binding protein YceI
MATVPAASLRQSPTTLEIDAEQTKVEFTLSDVLHTVHGNFKLKSGRIHFDPESGQASGQLVVDAASGASGSDGRDRRMHKNILESAKFPEITFTPDHFEGRLAPDGDSEIALHGTFYIHGVGHELVLKTAIHRSGDLMTASAHFEVPYVAWGMKNPSTLFLRVSDKVDINLRATGQLKAEQ